MYELEEIKKALLENEKLSSLTPRLRIPDKMLEKFPKIYSDMIKHAREWSVNSDG